ncbi:hypothetical protein [Opitutus sp. GAS368]|jgi:hypothetical protein|uniref:hypothetical protein n=1 Tax=Opitutus sp. GAS368 TaxID=1882749 RepID=UPI00087BBA1F|nr:hypothetical protein [Opitutus sp. GAS368]SDR72305.1 hypothetical protein SAMN05444173_0602 [Opitutus sp. GAS368]
MNLPDAHVAILQAFARMKALYHQPVFNEWVLVKLARESGAILAYDGPRADLYQAKFKNDIAPLQAEIESRKMAVGDFAFIHGADGTHYDACIRLGPAAYLFCNHTTKTMDDIRRDQRWLAAQEPFAELCAKFRDDPLK